MLRLRWITWAPVPYWTDRFSALADRGVDMQVVFMCESDRAYDFLLDPTTWRFPFRILRRREIARGSPIWLTPIDALRMGLELQDRRLVVPYGSPALALSTLVAHLRGSRYSLFVASSADNLRSPSRINEIVKRWVFRHAERCLATGPAQLAYARSYAPETPVSVVGNPIDISRLLGGADGDSWRRSMREQFGWADRFVIGYVGRLAPEKDIPILIRAAAGLASRGVAVAVGVAGVGAMERPLRELAQRLSIDTRFLGFLEGAKLGEFYKSIDALCLPSLSEPWGLVVNEAMAMSVPVVVSSKVGARCLVKDEETGFVFPAGDEQALIDRLARLAASQSMRHRIGSAGWRVIQGSSVDAWVDAVIGAFRN